MGDSLLKTIINFSPDKNYRMICYDCHVAISPNQKVCFICGSKKRKIVEVFKKNDQAYFEIFKSVVFYENTLSCVGKNFKRSPERIRQITVNVYRSIIKKNKLLFLLNNKFSIREMRENKFFLKKYSHG